MAFANKLYAYLRSMDRKVCPLVLLSPKQQYTHDTEIRTDPETGKVVQIYHKLDGCIEIPDEIKFEPVSVEKVMLATEGSSVGPINFVVKRDGGVEVIHSKELDDADKMALEMEIKALGYSSVEYKHRPV